MSQRMTEQSAVHCDKLTRMNSKCTKDLLITKSDISRIIRVWSLEELQEAPGTPYNLR